MNLVDLLMIGTGPSNIALAVGLEERNDLPSLKKIVMLEKDASTNWHKDMLFPESQSQVSFLKDLVTLRNPTSKFSFLNFLHENGRLDEFVNLQSFFPYRREISSYLQWAVNVLSKVEVKYSSEVSSVEPILDDANNVDGWIVKTSAGDVYKTKRLVFGAGRDANIPPVFRGLNPDRLFHSTRFLSKIKAYQSDKVGKIAVIGGAQSSAEVYQSCLEKFPTANVKMLMRSIGLTNYGGSKFINTIYQNEYIDTFYHTNPEVKSEILAGMHNTNYAGVAPSTVEALYRFHYLQNLDRKSRAKMITQSEIVKAEDVEGGIRLTWRSNVDATSDSEVFDFVVLGTGFSNSTPKLLQPSLRQFGATDFKVSRNYRADLPYNDGVSLHLQGINESSHGIADTLLSVIACRSMEILDDIAVELSSKHDVIKNLGESGEMKVC